MYNDPSVCVGYLPNNFGGKNSRHDVLSSIFPRYLLIFTVRNEAPQFPPIHLTAFQLCGANTNWNEEVAYTSISLLYGPSYDKMLDLDSLM